ncbi:hypothetical protein Tco_0410570 [Tanacetum coccineum]
MVGTAVRTSSSCTKEEVDAILIQCGRLSWSSSGVKMMTVKVANGGGSGGWWWEWGNEDEDEDVENK